MIPEFRVPETDPAGPASTGPEFVLSDLHLGHDMSLIRRVTDLRPILEGAARIIFNGDTMEDRAPAFKNKAEDQFSELLELCRSVGAESIVLNGNHDPCRHVHDYLDLADGRIFITHGHAMLRLISPWSTKLKFCRAAMEEILAEHPIASTSLNAQMELTRRLCLIMPPSETRQTSHSLRAKVGVLARELWPPRRPWEVIKVWAMLPHTASRFVARHRPTAQLFVFGHTHRPGIWRRRGRVLINTGGFVTFCRPWGIIIEPLGAGAFAREIAWQTGCWRWTQNSRRVM